MTELQMETLGERRLVSEVLSRFVRGIGDDCAVLGPLDGSVVATTDPVPVPAASLLGDDRDPYFLGWLLVTINASDLAAAGARPAAFLAAIDAPGSTPLSDFERILTGIADSCTAHGLAYVGGNLREGKAIAAVGTAIGHCPNRRPLSRRGIQADSILCSVGEGGRFWRDVGRVRDGCSVDKAISPLYRPIAQTAAMVALAERGLVLAAADNSDGLVATLEQLAADNQVTIVAEIENLMKMSGASENARFALGWGDWNVVIAVRPSDLPEVWQVALDGGFGAFRIGRIAEGVGGVFLERQSKLQRAPRLESERFAKDSWFVAGIEAYRTLLLEYQLP